MKNKYSSRRVFIPWIIVVIIFSVLVSTFFFMRLQDTFKERQHSDACIHLEDYASTISEVVAYNFNKNWNSLEIVKNFCENYEGTDFEKLQKFLKEKKDVWSNNRITLITESGRLYNENAETVIRPKVAKKVENIAEEGKSFSTDGHNLDYILNVDSKITIKGERIIAVSTAITFNSTINFDNIKQFESMGYLSLINNNGTKLAEQPNPKIRFPNNVFSYLQNCDVSNFSEDKVNISTALQEGKTYLGFMKNQLTKESHYFIFYPLGSGEKYEATRCHLFFMVPEDVISRNHFDFSRYITRLSIFLILMICVSILLVFLVAYKSKSRLIQDDMHKNEVAQYEKLKLALAMAEQSNKAKSSFLSNMSHDIRTPLNAIISMSDFALQEKDIQPKVLNYLNIIKKSSSHLLQLINNVLDMSRIDSGKFVIKEEPFDFGVLINDVANIIHPDCKKKKITLYTESFIDHTYLIGDKLIIQRILINLLSNAVKFTPELGSIWFSIEEKPTLRDGKCAFQISVEDTGFGIKKENLETIFSPFSREDNEKTANIEGTGLGLAITKNLIETMGGSISVASEENKGTKFTVDIFFTISSAEKISEKESEKTKKVGNDFGGIKALVVEDNAINRQIINILLHNINIECDFAENGRIALEKFNAAPEKAYDLIYMDIQMPELNGYETTKALRSGEKKEGHTIPIIAMTANVFDEDVEKCRKAGMNAHIGKPIDPSQLAYVTNQVLSRQKSDVNEKEVGGGSSFLTDTTN